MSRMGWPFLFLLLLSACGGSSESANTGSNTDNTNNGKNLSTVNAAPRANAGAYQAVLANSQVTLNANQSSDDKGIVTFRWAQTSGPIIALSNPSSATTVFRAPNTASNVLLSFIVKVEDEEGLSDSEEVYISVGPPAADPSPVDPPPNEEVFSISGKVFTTDISMLDSDVNNPQQVSTPNNSYVTAQRISYPVTVGGYLNAKSSGPLGSSFNTGDTKDYFSAQLLKGQVITLLITSPPTDLDLYLINSDTEETVDSSVGTGATERVVVPATGEYYILAKNYGGASGYTLILGNDDPFLLSTDNLRLSDDFVPGEIIVQQKTSPGASSATQLAKTASGTVSELTHQAGTSERESLYSISADNPNPSGRLLKNGALATPFKFASAEDQLKWQTLMTIKSLRLDPTIEYAEPNYIHRENTIPDDLFFPSQWHYPKIHAPSAWEISTGSSDVTVAVIDSGVLLNHPDLQGQLVPGFDFISDPFNAQDGDGIDDNPNDAGFGDDVTSTFHGTHVAGIIAASSNNRVGVAGVAWNAKVMPLRAAGRLGGNAYDINQAVRYAAGLPNDSGRTANPPVDIINLSLGSGGYSQASQDVYTAARNAGVIVVAAAGNDGARTATYPAAYNGVVSVSAVTATGEAADYSNYGETIDLAAPGGDLGNDVTNDGEPDGIVSTIGIEQPTGIEFSYGMIEGTSAAAPQVAGVFALMKSVNPDLTPSDIDALLRSGVITDDLGIPGRDNDFGFGLINARKAVDAANGGAPPPEGPAVLETSATAIHFGLSRSADLTLSNSGTGSLRINSVRSSATWLQVIDTSVNEVGLGRWTIQVDTQSLADGLYTAEITIDSSSNDVTLPVTVQVGASAFAPSNTIIYAILVDQATQRIEQIIQGSLENREMAIQFNNVPRGEYVVYAGSDNDFNKQICEVGELCGSWGSVNQTTAIQLDGNMRNIDFHIDHTFTTLPIATE